MPARGAGEEAGPGNPILLRIKDLGAAGLLVIGFPANIAIAWTIRVILVVIGTIL
ncbi:hypothetical protein [Streptomyces sp. NPDC002889]|uniref:hypothetical protein n=1 Tax=Streptomyces sp. NPDC002889 TaxID=3364669 RepID=UPI003690E9E3